MKIKIKTTEAAAPTGSGTASNVSSATCVRAVNSGTTARLVTVELAGGTDIGTFTMPGGTVEYIEKDPTDKIFAAHAEILLSAVGFK
tara:strand:- start:196 stop:456 length:261 start_codon:yes stop_codon:yes gene_type:complete